MIYQQARDVENQIIGGAISQIPSIINYTVVSGTWTPVITTVDTKEIIVQSRSIDTWLFSTISGEPFFTVKNGGAINARLVTASGTTIGWVSTDQSTDIIIEILQGR